jgi:tetratricopeptide (TPR) repeat protein
VRAGVVLVVLAAASSVEAAPAPRRAPSPDAGSEPALWRWVASAAGSIVDGDLVGAFAALTRARAARRVPELDALAGLVALQGGERAAAQRRLQAAAESRADEPLIYYWAARAELAGGRVGAALKRLEQALAVGGDRPVLRMGHALLLLEAKQAERAAASLLVAAAATPDLLDPSLFPSPVEGAVDLLAPLFRRLPARGKLVRTQGHLLWRAGKVLAAQRVFRELLGLDADDADALQMLARTQLALGEEEAAAASFDKALRLAPDMPQARAGRGELLMERKEAARAVEELRHAADSLPRDGALLQRLAEACVAAEKPDCARRFFGYALVRDRRLAGAHFGLALLEQQAGETAKAREHLRQAIALEPGGARYYQAAAQLESTAGDRAQARRFQAEARRAAGSEAEHRRRVDAARQEARRQVAALRELARSPRCDSTSCRTAVARLAEPPRAFLQAHLALKQGDRSRAAELLRVVLSRLHARSLFLADPTQIETAGSTSAGRRYVLRSTTPLVPSTRLR